jgi:hypothetical protein
MDMKRMLAVAIFGAIMTTSLCADSPPPTTPYPSWPGGPESGAPQPSATMARLNKRGQVVLKFWKARWVPMTATRVIRDGKEVNEKHSFFEFVGGWTHQTYDLKDIKLLGSDGKPLDKKMLPELLKKERPVLYIHGVDKIDPTFLKVIKEGTPIFVLPLPSLPEGPPDAPS